MTSGAKMLLQFCALGVTMSWDDGFLGARASRPHQAWHSLGHLPHLDQPGTEPWLSFGLADAVPAHRVAACSIALKLSGGQRDRMRAGRPRSQAITPPLRGSRRSRAARRRLMRWGVAGNFSEGRPAPFGKLPFARQPCSCPGVRIIRKRSNEPSWPIGNKNHVPLTRFSGLGNIDTQDRQDKQAEKLLHGKRTDSLIGCVSEVIHEPGSGFWESVLKHRRWLNSRR